jgi:FtsP/CotA-like multicopper oxidase with cupredoxin domain
MTSSTANRRRVIIGVVATAVILGPLGWLWQDSLMPSSYSVMDMGYPDLGGGPAVAGHGSGAQHSHAAAGPGAVSVASLTGPRDQPADTSVTLVARKEQIRLGSGPRVDGYTLNHTSPGPEIRAMQGRIVEVRLVNESVPDGVTLHWHGVDVPNAEDGVAGVTQDAVEIGEEHLYRFVPPDAGTFWYHSHQVSHEQVRKGLLGTLVVEPSRPSSSGTVDVVAPVHTYDARPTIRGQVGESRIAVRPGSRVRVRIINTDEGPMRAWATGAPYRVVAIDGRDLNAPTPVEDTRLLLTAGGRADLELTTPANGSAVRIGVGGPTSLLLGPPGAPEPATAEPTAELDLLGYGKPAPIGFAPESAQRRFEYRIGRRPGFLDGRPGMWWTINSHLWPDVPMYLVAEGDVVRMTLANSSGKVHPMHLHGHHAVVLSRDGKAATGSPWWVDSLNVANGETYEIAFVADNPGIWMDHCHNLPHAKQGLVAHLAYSGVTEPFRVGGQADNQPE